MKKIKLPLLLKNYKTYQLNDTFCFFALWWGLDKGVRTVGVRLTAAGGQQ